MSIEIVSINIGQVDKIGDLHRKPVMSAIYKTPVESEFIHAREHVFEGDEQADLEVHGGPAKGIYFYPYAHYAYWEDVLHTQLRPGAFGENVTVDGVDENSVHIGDTWAWGDVCLRITGPRRPCYKLGILYPKAPALMVRNGFCGWYAQVIVPGLVPTTGRIHVFSGLESGPTVRQVFRDKKLETKPIPGPRESPEQIQ